MASSSRAAQVPENTEAPLADWQLDPSLDPDACSTGTDDSFQELGAITQPGSTGARVTGPYSPESGEYDSDMEFMDHYLPSAQTSFAVPPPAPAAPSAPSPEPRGRKRKAPTGPPPPSRPFKRQQHVSPARTPAQVRVVVKGEAFHRMIGLPKNLRTNYCDSLPKLRRDYPYLPDPKLPAWDFEWKPGMAQNGYDAVKKHFDVAHVKWEMSVAEMSSRAAEMVKYGTMLRDEAHACHRWVGQVGTQTWGEEGRMKNYDAFNKALEQVKEMAKKAEELVKLVEGDAKRWSMEFAKKRRDWDEEEISATEESSEGGEESE
ncbi:hypothetical protein B0T20DRAFT_440334 [Sordaria brevicollis]|uniref:Uncharacterized protein n=1 Tax=Sordaria brevicollis TaxID=83679 RepID=A0AAE0PBN8_SORBR|nr:hypothetical protein B0T20DRAFT_440334 [Sordaria brevicollis]